MSTPRKRHKFHRPRPSAGPQNQTTDHSLEKEPAVEWGEGIHTGKTIARGGKTTGHVPGADPSSGTS
jgi:hypothetical protein